MRPPEVREAAEWDHAKLTELLVRELWGGYIRERPFAVNMNRLPYRTTPQHFGTIWHPPAVTGIKKSKGADLSVVSRSRRRTESDEAGRAFEPDAKTVGGGCVICGRDCRPVQEDFM